MASHLDALGQFHSLMADIPTSYAQEKVVDFYDDIHNVATLIGHIEYEVQLLQQLVRTLLSFFGFIFCFVSFVFCFVLFCLFIPEYVLLL